MFINYNIFIFIMPKSPNWSIIPKNSKYFNISRFKNNFICFILFLSKVVLAYKSPNIKSISDNYHAKKPKLLNSSPKVANFWIKVNLEIILYVIF
jgi:hypothetical protein